MWWRLCGPIEGESENAEDAASYDACCSEVDSADTSFNWKGHEEVGVR